MLLVCTENYEESASFSLCGPLTWLNSPYRSLFTSTIRNVIDHRWLALMQPALSSSVVISSILLERKEFMLKSKTNIICCTVLCAYIYVIKFHGIQQNRASVRIKPVLMIWKQNGRLAVVTSSRVWALVFDPLASAELRLAVDASRSSKSSNYGHCIFVLKTRLRNNIELKRREFTRVLEQSSVAHLVVS